MSYLRDLAISLEIDRKVTLVSADTWDAVLSACLEGHKRAGPFQRMHVVWEWEGEDAASLAMRWRDIVEQVWLQVGVRPRLIVCRPSFLIWILWHFEDVESDCQANEVRKRLERVLKRSVGVHVPALHARTVVHLGEAIRRARQKSRLRQVGGAGGAGWMMETNTDLHELVIAWYRLARRELPE
ncbi:MAG: hypothetical protein HQL86_07550 [Magnetococcales bacterium]|nr:hypothetical protein [Magnetococcales bacterium]